MHVLTPLRAQSWEWQYGQTPEFTHEITGSFDFGSLVGALLFAYGSPTKLTTFLSQTLSIDSRHGLITSASVPSPPVARAWAHSASELCGLLAGDRYETMEQTTEAVRGRAGDEGERLRELLEWLRREM